MSHNQVTGPARVAVLSGGESAERAVSLRSGEAVRAALVEAGHQATVIDPAESALDTVDWLEFDAALIALHGGAGEDGTIQSQLDRLGVPYSGSSPQACRLAMSKSASKSRFAERRVPTPRWVSFRNTDSIATVVADVAWLGYPVVVKPDGEGSSIGVNAIQRASELSAAIAAAASYDHLILAERLVSGREFTVAVMGRQALPMIEIVTPGGLFSYEAKYHSDQTQLRFDFALDVEARDALVAAAVAATQAIGTSGLARVDLMLDAAGRPWVLEVNTCPGMTGRSLAPMAAARAGWEMPELVDRMIRECLVTECVA
jgi:D-alanine-D-alanine ligase